MNRIKEVRVLCKGRSAGVGEGMDDRSLELWSCMVEKEFHSNNSFL
jgi:hypothetical protein